MQQTNQHIEDYMVQNGFHLINSPFLAHASMFVKDDKAVLFYDDVIEVKISGNAATKNHAATVLFQWHSVAMFKGFDYSEFKLMMLLDFMGAISLKDVNRQLRKDAFTNNLLANMNLYNSNPVYLQNTQPAHA